MDFPQPPYPPETRAKGYRFEIDYERVNQSDTWALASAEQRPWLLMLWLVAWQQTPCGTLPDNDLLVAARLGMQLPAFMTNRDVLLRNWRKHSDERLYHPVITELVLEKIERKERETQRKAAYRKNKRSEDVPQMSHGTDTGQARDSSGNDDTGTGTGTGMSKPYTDADASVVASRLDDDVEKAAIGIPDCPQQEVIAMYGEVLPALPHPRAWEGQRVNNLKARWRWVLTAKTSKGKRYATDKGSALDFFRRFFQYVAESDFLTGRDGKWQGCNLGWLVKAENFAKVLEGHYENREAA